MWLNQEHPCCCASHHGTGESIQGKEYRGHQEILPESLRPSACCPSDISNFLRCSRPQNTVGHRKNISLPRRNMWAVHRVRKWSKTFLIKIQFCHECNLVLVTCFFQATWTSRISTVKMCPSPGRNTGLSPLSRGVTTRRVSAEGPFRRAPSELFPDAGTDRAQMFPGQLKSSTPALRDGPSADTRNPSTSSRSAQQGMKPPCP